MRIDLKAILALIVSLNGLAQRADTIEINEKELVSMNDTYAKSENGKQKYYANGSSLPYTGFLSARYDNGQLESVQQFEDGLGNGIWINYDPDGRKECQGTYINNRVEGPVTFFYGDGSVKSKGHYRNFKKAIAWWTFYDRKGNIVSKRKYTR